jgi:hypothetical protein
MFGDRCLEDSYFLSTDPFFDGLTILEEDHRRDRHDTRLTRDLRITIDIMLGNYCLAWHLGGELLETREHELTWTTPLRPKINENEASTSDISECSISRNLERHIWKSWKYKYESFGTSDSKYMKKCKKSKIP